MVDQPDVSTYFTPIAITLNVDSFEHSTSRPGPTSCSSTRSSRATSRSSSSSRPGGDGTGSPFEPRQLAFDTSGYVQMELQGLDLATAEE